MTIRIAAHVAYHFPETTDFLLQIEAAMLPEQHVSGPGLSLSAVQHRADVIGADTIGRRTWLRADGDFTADFVAEVTIDRQIADISRLDQLAPHQLPGEAVPYLFDSRFCQADQFQSFVEAEFGDLVGGPRIAAMRDWVQDKFTYAPGSSTATTTALESFVERRGVCRDYAHIICTLARASAIPARYISCYAPGVDPPDFHAVAEVFMRDPDSDEPDAGSWQLIDATGMAMPAQIAKIAVGRDAADVSFLTSYGMAQMREQTIEVSQGD